jgi:CubicO group peptidase (beta-lactamase class C family)
MAGALIVGPAGVVARIAAFALLLAGAAAAQPLPDDAALAARARAYVDDARLAPGVVIGVLEADGSRRFVAHGASGHPHRTPLGPGSVFEIGSITKVHTALLLAQMVAAGEVAYDQRIATLFPADLALAEPLASITLEQLATHTSGLPRLALSPANLLRGLFSDDPYAGSTPDEIFRAVAGADSARLGERGRFNYSNLGVALLGQLLARKAGIDYSVALAQRVFAPLGLHAWPLTPLPRDAPSFVQGHGANFRPAAAWHLDAYAPAGGLQASAAELLDFAASQLAAGTDWVRDAQRLRQPLDATSGRSNALGWAVQRLGTREVWWHNGGTGGFRTYLAIVPAEGIALVVLTNGKGDADALARGILDPARPMPQGAERTALAVLATLGGLLFAVLLGFAVRARAYAGGRARAIDRWDVIGAGLSMGMILLLVERLGDFARVPFVLWWLAALASGALLAHLVWRARQWPWRSDRGWRFALRLVGVVFTGAVVALLV